MAIVTNWDAPVVAPHMAGSAGSVAGMRVRREDSWDSALEALSAVRLSEGRGQNNQQPTPNDNNKRVVVFLCGSGR